MRQPHRPSLFSWLNQAFRSPRRTSLRAWPRRKRLEMECLEARTLPSGIPVLPNIAHTDYIVLTNGVTVSPLGSPASPPYSPSQILSAYGFNLLSDNGAGQTIAIRSEERRVGKERSSGV